MARSNVRLCGDDVILMQYERQCRLEAEAEQRARQQDGLDEKYRLHMIGWMMLLGALLTGIVLLAWWNAQ